MLSERVHKIMVLIAALVFIFVAGAAGWSAWQIAHQCAKQCDWGDKRCADMCGARHFCPAHPDGL